MQPIIQCIMRDIVTILIRCQINLLFARLQLQVLWPCYFVILGTLTFFDMLCCWVVLWEQRFTSRRYPSLHHYNWQWFSNFEFYHYLKYFIFKTIQKYVLKNELLVHWIWNDRNFWFAWCTMYAKYKIFSQAIYFTSNDGVFTFISCPYTHDYA